ncbi:MAG: secreted trypsin-like serine protease [Myxococcales bacterium]|nr:secreted trypsin-like serine protease [Myxococcales bacterium]
MTSIALAESGSERAAAPPQQDAIPVVGGTQVPAGKWPDAVAVLGPQGSCTGTLIAPDVVITAGHCSDINPRQVIVNTIDYAAQGGTTFNVLRTVAYPSWQTSYDISVIVLEHPVTGIEPRKVGTSCTFQGFSNNMQVHLVGFGLTNPAGTGNNSVLNETMAPILDRDCSGGRGCKTAIAPGGEFVAGGNSHDSCFGDSGGPVYLDTPRGVIVVGAVSRGVDGSAMPCGSGGIYVRTDKTVQWIEQTTGETIAKDDCAAAPGDGSNAGSGTGSGGGSNDYGSGPIETGGCSSSRDSSIGGLVLIALFAIKRRR